MRANHPHIQQNQIKNDPATMCEAGSLGANLAEDLHRAGLPPLSKLETPLLKPEL